MVPLAPPEHFNICIMPTCYIMSPFLVYARRLNDHMNYGVVYVYSVQSMSLHHLLWCFKTCSTHPPLSPLDHLLAGQLGVLMGGTQFENT